MDALQHPGRAAVPDVPNSLRRLRHLWFRYVPIDLFARLLDIDGGFFERW